MPWFAPIAAVVGTVVSVAATGISLIAGQSAASQAAANAQAAANYNAQIQEQNAQVALQLQTYQAQQNAAVASQQNALIVSQQRQQEATARSNMLLARSQQAAIESQTAIAKTTAGIEATQSRLEASIAESNRRTAEVNAQFARQQAEGAQQRHDAGLENAKQLDIYAEQVQAEQREQARRLREEADTRHSQIRAKYAGSGVTFEGSPLVVLADAARLSETLVQDAAFVSELEARKQQRAAVLERFEAGFHLLDKQGFLTQATGFEIQGSAFGTEALGHELAGAIKELQGTATVMKGAADIFGLQIEGVNQRAQIAQSQYEGLIQESRYESQLAAANYDTLVAGERHKIAMAEADLTRFEGSVTASGYKAQGTASLISGIGDLGSSISTGAQNISKMPAFAPKTAPPQGWPGVSAPTTGFRR